MLSMEGLPDASLVCTNQNQIKIISGKPVSLERSVKVQRVLETESDLENNSSQPPEPL